MKRVLLGGLVAAMAVATRDRLGDDPEPARHRPPRRLQHPRVERLHQAGVRPRTAPPTASGRRASRPCCPTDWWGCRPRPTASTSLAVEPALGEHAQRRLVGCLEDATVDLVSAHVVSVSS